MKKIFVLMLVLSVFVLGTVMATDATANADVFLNVASYATVELAPVSRDLVSGETAAWEFADGVDNFNDLVPLAWTIKNNGAVTVTTEITENFDVPFSMSIDSGAPAANYSAGNNTSGELFCALSAPANWFDYTVIEDDKATVLITVSY